MSAQTTGPAPCSGASSIASTNGDYTANELASAYGFSSLYAAGDEGAEREVLLGL